jgi:hypothetical protein
LKKLLADAREKTHELLYVATNDAWKAAVAELTDRREAARQKLEESLPAMLADIIAIDEAAVAFFGPTGGLPASWLEITSEHG